MSWVDAFVAAYMDVLEAYFPEILESYPKCKEIEKRVKNIPLIAQWIEKRPGWHVFENPLGF
ncbi:hypothetical protein SK128_018030 [Halocaridina rubra]|uniref:GST C-terminal domain-containing protein n=1 Tax=Halocaridina rubra TaxID=373956 RepID=A0AAN8WNR0_HALRR